MGRNKGEYAYLARDKARKINVVIDKPEELDDILKGVPNLQSTL